MIKPKRHTRTRAKGSKLPEGVKCVTRPGKWGNPFTTASLFEIVLECCVTLGHPPTDIPRPRGKHMMRIANDIEELRGLDLACWCKQEATDCHADVLLDYANRG